MDTFYNFFMYITGYTKIQCTKCGKIYHRKVGCHAYPVFCDEKCMKDYDSINSGKT